MRTPPVTVAIVGVGLIGGSIGLALKKRNLARRVIGVGRGLAKLQQAKRIGAIDEAALDLPAGVSAADIVVFCTPVDCVAEQIKKAARCAKKTAVFTDAGSTKAAIVAAVDATSAVGGRFVGAHPLAGSEKKGVAHADADLFVGRWTVLTPSACSKRETFVAVEDFWKSLGAKVRKMTPEDHDRAMAWTSHVPHLIAAALAGILPGGRRELAASGFRDTTRIAGGDPEVWTPIFQQNRAAMLAVLDEFQDRLGEFRQALLDEDVARIGRLLAQGKKVRDALGS